MNNSDVPLSIEDVVDFYRKWPDLRSRVRSLITDGVQDADDQELLRWMIKIIDRIGPHDVDQNN